MYSRHGTNGANRGLLIQTQYLSGDYAGAARELTAEIQAAEKSGGRTVPRNGRRRHDDETTC